jgi:hypothetical protein
MARKKSKGKMTRRMNKIEPAVQTLTFTAVVPKGEGGSDGTLTQFLDLSQVASVVNRRFYRQGLNWAVSGFKFNTAPALTGGIVDGSVIVAKLPNSWTMSNSWHKTFAHWQEMNNNALAESESIRPRFLDFKIYADDTHHAAGFAANMTPLSALGVAATMGEWEPSKMVIPVGSANPGAAADRELIAVGANYPGLGASGLDAVSLIEGYAASRLLPNVLDPNTPDDADDATGFNPDNWLAATFSEGTDQTADVLEYMISENNIAPYPFENDGINLDTMYPGGANQLTGLELHDLTCLLLLLLVVSHDLRAVYSLVDL